MEIEGLKKMSRIIHLFYPEKVFLKNFTKFLKENFPSYTEEHTFFLFDINRRNISQRIDKNIEYCSIDQYSLFLKKAKKSSKIILHGAWADFIILKLLKHKKLMEKVYWIMWGGDFNPIKFQPETRIEFMKNVKNVITDNIYDYKYVQSHIKEFNPKLYRSFFYPTNIFNFPEDIKFNKDKDNLNILIGNSADPYHNHIEMLEKLVKYKNENIKIFVPLSYCNIREGYIEEVINFGKNHFKEKFFPILNFMPLREYQKFLSTIDIAFFPAKRQQAMGNIITLLGLGKKVFLNTNVTTFNMFCDMGIKVFDIDKLNLEKLPESIALKNSKKIKNHYSKENLINQLSGIFES